MNNNVWALFCDVNYETDMIAVFADKPTVEQLEQYIYNDPSIETEEDRAKAVGNLLNHDGRYYIEDIVADDENDFIGNENWAGYWLEKRPFHNNKGKVFE